MGYPPDDREERPSPRRGPERRSGGQRPYTTQPPYERPSDPWAAPPAPPQQPPRHESGTSAFARPPAAPERPPQTWSPPPSGSYTQPEYPQPDYPQPDYPQPEYPQPGYTQHEPDVLAGPGRGRRPKSDPWGDDDFGPVARSRKPLWIGAGVVALLVVAAGGGVLLARSPSDPTRSSGTPPAAHSTPGKQPSAAASSPAAQSPRPTAAGQFGFADSRATDPEPLTVEEFFGAAKVTVNGRTYTRSVSREDEKCADAVEGTRLRKAIASAGCTQIVRASYSDSSGKVIGTIGVANLTDSTQATKIADIRELHEYVKPLPGKDATRSLGTGDARGGAWHHGHYAILLWFQFKDGHKPTAAEAKLLDRAAKEIADGAIFPALDVRSTTGRPKD